MIHAVGDVGVENEMATVKFPRQGPEECSDSKDVKVGREVAEGDVGVYREDGGRGQQGEKGITIDVLISRKKRAI